MNISITINIDDEQLTPNEELNTTLSEIVTSYIRQTLGGKKVKKEKKLKDLNAPKIAKRPWTDDDETYAIDYINQRAGTMSTNKIMKELGPQINRSHSSLNGKVWEWRKDGRLK